jgi:MFS family permease
MKLTVRPESAPLTPGQKIHGQRWIIRCSVIAMLYWAGLNDRVISLFILRLNPAASDAALAFFFAVGPMTAILTAAVSPLVERYGKKCFLVPFYFAAAGALLFLPGLPALGAAWGPAAAMIGTGTVLTVYAMLRSLGMAGWFPIIDDNVPAESRGRFFARVRTSWQLMYVACSLAVGVILGPAPTLGRFQFIFAVAFAASLVMTIGIMTIPEPPLASRSGQPAFLRMLGMPFRDGQFVTFVAFGVLYNLALSMPGPSAVRCMKHTLGAGDNFVVWMDTLASIGAAATLPLWGRFVDRFGGRLIFALLLPPLALVNLLWLAAAPSLAHWPHLIGAYAILQGVCVFGISVGITDIMLGGAREGQRSAYINIAFVANTLAAGVGPFLGAAITQLLGGFEGHWGLLFLDGNRWVFLFRTGLFLLPLLLVRRLSREHGGNVGESLQQLSDGLMSRLPPFFRPR